jgi:hypothetical protein
MLVGAESACPHRITDITNRQLVIAFALPARGLAIAERTLEIDAVLFIATAPPPLDSDNVPQRFGTEAVRAEEAFGEVLELVR